MRGQPSSQKWQRKVAGKGDVNVGLAKRGLERGGIAHVLHMETVAEEEVLEFCAPWILVRSIEIAVGITVHCQNNPR